MADPAPVLTLQLGGSARLLLPDGSARVIEGTAALLAVRVALLGHQARAELARLLWPDTDELRARANLRQRLLRLRKLAGREWIVGDADLRLAGDVRLDDDGPGELLIGLDAQIASDELRQWLEAARRARHQRQRTALEAEADAADAAHDWPAALAAAGRLLGLEPHSEEAHRRRIRLLYLMGDAGRAAQAAADCQAMLAREFGAAPSAQTRALAELVARGLPAAPPATAAAPALPTALLRPPRMVGRDAELALLRAAAHAGRAALVLGEAGMGKSRLLAEVAAQWPRERIAAVKAQAGDAGVPYATLARLLHGACCAGGLQPPALWPAQGATDAAARRLQLEQAVAATLAQLGLALVLVDDLHFADAASLELMQALAAREPAGEGAVPAGPAWLLAQRPGEANAAAHALQAALQELPQSHHVALRPLSVPQMQDLLRAVGLPEDTATALAPQITRHCGGNPLFALETLRQMPLQGAAGSRLPQPASIGTLIERRMRQLSPPALALARAAAIAGPDFSPALAEAVLARPAIELADAWAELEAAQVLREQAFAHDLVFEAVLASVPRPIAQHLHGAVARWLEARDGEPARVAEHWLAAGEAATALPWLLRAAERSERGARLAEAAGFLARAAAFVEAHPAAAGLDASELHYRVAQARWSADGTDAARAPLERALALARTPQQRARVLGQLAFLAQRTGIFDDSRRFGLRALEEAEASGDDGLISDAMMVIVTTLALIDEAAHADELVQRHWQVWRRARPDDPEPAAARAMVLDALGRTGEARAFHELAVQLLSDRQSPADHLVHLGNWAINRMDAGALDQAAAILDRAAALEAAHTELPANSQARMRALVARDRGRFRQALAEYERALAIDGTGSASFVKLLHLNRSLLWAAIGQWGRALQDLAAMGDVTQMPRWVHWRAQLVRRQLARGQGQVAPAVAWPEGDDLQALSNPAVRYAIRLCQAEEQARTPEGAAAALRQVQGIEADAQERGLLGVAWAARLRGLGVALAAGEHAQAEGWALLCARRDADITPMDLQDGAWWHALWRAWLQLGDAPRADAARSQGLAWLQRTLEHELDAGFHAGFKAVPEHRALLLGAVPG